MELPAELYEPSKWGAEFHRLPHDEALGAGSAGPGKSFVLLMDPFEQIINEHLRCFSHDACHAPWCKERATCKEPDHRFPLEPGGSMGVAWFLRREYPTLTESVNRSLRIFRRVDPQAVWSKSERTWRFASGYTYVFHHCANPSDWSRFMSNECSGLGFDEVNQFTEEQYENISGRVRSGDPVLRYMLKIRSACNPTPCTDTTERNPHWVRDRFVAPHPLGRKTIRSKITLRSGEARHWSRIFLPAKLWDNPDPTFVETFEKNLRSRPKHIRRALLEGDWYSSANSFFGEVFEQDYHVVRPFKIPVDWPIFRAMDWGFKTNGVVGWYAQDPDGNLVKFREYTFREKSARHVAERIKEWEESIGLWVGGRSAITGPADTQLWEERGETGVSKAAEMAEVGVTWVRADKRSRARNAERVYERLEDHRDHTTKPGLTFFENCRMTIQTLPTLQADKNDPEVPAKGGDDHWYDETSYACAYASRGSIPLPRTETEDEDSEELRQANPRSGWGYGG